MSKQDPMQAAALEFVDAVMEMRAAFRRANEALDRMDALVALEARQQIEQETQALMERLRGLQPND